MESYTWNSVVVGAWNTAILSPDGIRRRLLALPDDAPIELELAMDRPGYFRVGHNGIIVIPTSSALEVTARESNPANLGRACSICQQALIGLPETPVTAVGVNIRYRFAEMPQALLDMLRAPLEDRLSDAGHVVAESQTRRSLSYDPGVVNLQVTHKADASGTVEFNFHRQSTAVSELVEWLTKVEDFVALSRNLLETVGVIDVENVQHRVN